MDFNFDSGDIRGLANDFDRYGAALPAAARTAVTAETAHGMGLSIANAPYLTGHLRASHTMEVSDGGGTVVGEFGPHATYSGYVEHGTSRMAPRRYLGRAMDVIEGTFPDRCRTLLDPFGR